MITWPDVAMAAVLTTGFCVIMYFLYKAGEK